MKAITIWQPHATLLAVGIRKFNTRPWQTDFRGKVAIHAAKRKPGAREIKMLEYLRVAQLLPELSDTTFWPRGAIVAHAELIDCRPTEEAYPHVEGTPEVLLDNWTIGRYALEFGDVVRIEPSPVAGYLGLWEYHPK